MKENIIFMEGGGGHMDNEAAKFKASRQDGEGQQKPAEKEGVGVKAEGTPLKSVMNPEWKRPLEKIRAGRQRTQEPETRERGAVDLGAVPASEPGGASEEPNPDQEKSLFIPTPEISSEGEQGADKKVPEPQEEQKDEVIKAAEEGNFEKASQLKNQRDERDPKELEEPEAKKMIESLRLLSELVEVPQEQRDGAYYDKMKDALKHIGSDMKDLVKLGLANKGVPEDKIRELLPEVTPAPTEGGEGGVGVAPMEGDGKAEVMPGPLQKIISEAEDLAKEGKTDEAREKLRKGFEEHRDWFKTVGKGVWLTLIGSYFAYCFLMSKVGGQLAKQGGGK